MQHTAAELLQSENFKRTATFYFSFSFLFKSEQSCSSFLKPPDWSSSLACSHKTTLTSVCELNLTFGPKNHGKQDATGQSVSPLCLARSWSRSTWKLYWGTWKTERWLVTANAVSLRGNHTRQIWWPSTVGLQHCNIWLYIKNWLDGCTQSITVNVSMSTWRSEMGRVPQGPVLGKSFEVSWFIADKTEILLAWFFRDGEYIWLLSDCTCRVGVCCSR